MGISNYNTLETSWTKINGTNDIRLLSPILREQHFSITILLDASATAQNIRTEFKQLIQDSQKGDTIYLHFSCHGQPVEDKNGDEEDGWDESIIPIDAHLMYQEGIYEGQNHITDDEIDSVLSLLREKVGISGCVYLIIDACHAGTAVRNENMDESFTPFRGTNMGFSKNNIYRPKHQRCTSYIKLPKKSPNQQLSNVIVLEACLATQRNQEISVQDVLYGPLSYSLFMVMSHHGLECSKQWLSYIQNSMHSVLPPWSNQQMVIETNIP